MSLAVAPDERAFRTHIESGRFLRGVANHRWRLLSVQWPVAILAVSAADRPTAPTEYAFRLDVSGYPQQAPTARLWDGDSDTPLPTASRPTGVPGSSVERAFRTDWNGGNALYLPCDRVALQSHPAWAAQHPDLYWTPSRDISFFLRILHDLLHSPAYTGTRGS